MFTNSLRAGGGYSEVDPIPAQEPVAEPGGMFTKPKAARKYKLEINELPGSPKEGGKAVQGEKAAAKGRKPKGQQWPEGMRRPDAQGAPPGGQKG